MDASGEPAAAGCCKYKEKAEEPGDPTLTLVKWLVPSAGILFGLVGYVIDAAHRSLLAFPTDDGRLDDGGRIQDAADFLRFLVTLVADRIVTLGSFNAISLGGHGFLVLGCSVLLAAVLLGPFAAKRICKNEERGLAIGSFARRSLPWVALVLIGLKFVNFDAPAMRIESVIVGVGAPRSASPQAGAASAPASPAVSRTRSLVPRLEESTEGRIGSFIAQRAIRMWQLMMCARISTAPQKLDPAWGATCTETGEATGLQIDSSRARQLLAGEFDAGLWLGALIAFAAVALLLRRTAAQTALAVFSLVYLLSVPYAWGKLLKPVDFSYARVRAVADIFLVTTERAKPPEDVKAIDAFVLAKDAGSVTLLQGVREPCSDGPSIALRFSSLPTSKVVAIEQIYRQDVIEWALRTQRNCPQGPPPPATAP
jgi:hypothetical protein